MARCLLALGANLGDRAGSLDQALASISAIPGVQPLMRSTWHETTPIGGPAGQGKFLNGAVLLVTVLSPQSVARAMREIEERHGRDRKVRWGARTLDIDLLLFDSEVIDTPDLRIPHPRMSFRQFVLAPATEIAGEMVHPTSGWTLAAQLNHWRTAPRRVAIGGNDPELCDWLGDAISQELKREARDRDDPRTIKLVVANQNPTMIIDLANADQPIGPMRRMGPIGRIVRVRAGRCAEVLQEALAAIRAAWPD